MASLTDLFSSVFGPASPKMAPAAPLTSYPATDDAANALKYGFGYGDPRFDTSNGTARVLGMTSPARGKQPGRFEPVSGADVGAERAVAAAESDQLSRNVQSPQVVDALQRAALTANRIPIAALGFDPTRMAADTVIKNPTIAGLYAAEPDTVYFNMADGRPPSTPVHESIHRGLEILKHDPANAAAFNELPGEEYVVRHIMARDAGNPEQGSGPAADRQRETAETIFKGLGERRYNAALDSLTRAAEEAIMRRNPRGPH